MSNERQALEFVRDFITIGGNGEGWTWEHLEAVVKVALDDPGVTVEDRKLSAMVVGTAREGR